MALLWCHTAPCLLLLLAFSGSGFSEVIFNVDLTTTLLPASGAYPETPANTLFWLSLGVALNISADDSGVDIYFVLELPNDNSYSQSGCSQYMDGTNFGCTNTLNEVPFVSLYDQDAVLINVSFGSQVFTNSVSDPVSEVSSSEIRITLEDVQALSLPTNADLDSGLFSVVVDFPVYLRADVLYQNIYDFYGHVEISSGETNSTGNTTIWRVGTFLEMFEDPIPETIEAGSTFSYDVHLYNTEDYSLGTAENISVRNCYNLVTIRLPQLIFVILTSR